MTEFVDIIDRHGRRRRARKGDILADGERFFLPMQFMDAAAREVVDHLATKYGASGDSAIRVVDSRGLLAGHCPGFLFDSNRALIDVAERLAKARRKDRQDPVHDRGGRQPTLDELEAAATAAYEARSERMRTAWKTHHA